MLKFKGNFKDLIPMGFTFHKLFARNYKVYEMNKVWIWVAHGGYVEIDDHYDNSKYIAKAIIEGTYPVHEKTTYWPDGRPFFNKGEPKSCIIHRDTGEILEKRLHMNEWESCCNGENDDWREVGLYKKTFHFVKEIKKMLDINF